MNLVKPNLVSKNFPFTGAGGCPPKKLLKMMSNTFRFWNFSDLMIFGGLWGRGGGVYEKV